MLPLDKRGGVFDTGRMSGVLVNATLCIDTIEVPGRGRVEGELGGAAAYFAAAARLFGPVRVLAGIGADYPESLWARLVAMGLDLRGVARRSGPTFRWHGRYHEDLKDRDTLRADFDPAVEAVPPVPEAWRDTAYTCFGVSDPENQLAMRRLFPHATLTVMDTIEMYVLRRREALLQAIADVHGLVVNDWEARELTGHRDPTRAAEALRQLGPTFAIVKRGGEGSVLSHAQATWHCPAYRVDQVVDPTGAGDCYLGGLLGYLAQQQARAEDVDAVKRAMLHGAAAASFVVEDFGPRRIEAAERNELDRRVALLTATARDAPASAAATPPARP